MGAYNYMDSWIPGQSTEENQEVFSVRTRAAQEDISFGKPVCGYTGDESKAWNYKLDTTKLVFSGDLSASNSTVLTVDGVALTAVVFATTHLAAMQALAAKVKAATFVDGHGDTKYYDCIIDPEDATNRTLLIRAKGATSVSSGVVSGGSAVTITATYQSDQVFLGISYYSAKDVAFNAAAAYAKYFQNQDINIAEKGIVAVYVKGTILADKVAYIMATSGDSKLGYFYTSGDSCNAIFRSDMQLIGSDYLAALELRGMVKFHTERTWS